ncbi:MAG: ABC transporter permease, partial [Bacteroidetes bacterium]|nr:ABC transporter permease [Bacteroidota bacterium]
MKRFKLIYDIALQLLKARWKQTLVAAIGVTFSITMFITLLGFMNGLNDLLDGLILNRTPHIKLYNEIKPSSVQPIEKSQTNSGVHHFIESIKPYSGKPEIRNINAVMNFVKNDKRVKGIAPKITAQVFYNVGAVDLNGVINGIDVEAENRLYFFEDYVIGGNYADLKNVPNSIVLGKVAAEKMLAKVGDVIQITTAKGDRVQLKVVGFFQSGLADIDKIQSYTSISTAQKILGKPNSYITDLQVKLWNIELAPKVAKEYAQLFDI